LRAHALRADQVALHIDRGYHYSRPGGDSIQLQDRGHETLVSDIGVYAILRPELLEMLQPIVFTLFEWKTSWPGSRLATVCVMRGLRAQE